MSRETRIVRPFILGNRLDRCLDGVRVQFGAKCCEPGGNILVDDPDEYMRSVPKLSWEEDDIRFNAFRAALVRRLRNHGIEPDAAALVVTAYTGYLKITDVLVSRPVSTIDALARESVFHHPDRPRALDASTHGATITAYLVLRRDIERVTLRPWRKGTWLAAVTFRIRTGATQQLFRPIPMDAETRTTFGLPKNCVQYLNMGDHEPIQPYEDSSAPEFYVDTDLLARLDRAAGDTVGSVLQVQLVRDFVAGVVMDVVARDSDSATSLTWTELKGSLFGRIVAMAAGKDASVQEREGVAQLVRKNPGRLIALVEGALKLRLSLTRALTEDEETG